VGRVLGRLRAEEQVLLRDFVVAETDDTEKSGDGR
jgi:hypothetical protein